MNKIKKFIKMNENWYGSASSYFKSMYGLNTGKNRGSTLSWNQPSPLKSILYAPFGRIGHHIVWLSEGREGLESAGHSQVFIKIMCL